MYIVISPTRLVDDRLRGDVRDLAGSRSPASPWQTVEWNAMLLDTGYIMEGWVLGVYAGDTLVLSACIEQRSLGAGLTGLFVVGGPIVTDAAAIPLFEARVIELSRSERAVFVQVEPLRETPFTVFSSPPYKRFIERTTATIDLRQDVDTILANMKPKGRYNIRLAERSGVVTTRGTDDTATDVRAFYRIFEETLDRDGFSGNSLAYMETFLAFLRENDIGDVWFARREGEIIAAGIFVFFGETAYYYYGASVSDSERRRYMATYQVQWEAIQEAIRHGCTTYDFLGIVSDGSSDSHLAGVTEFKRKFTDACVVFPAGGIHIVRPVVYRMLGLYRRIRRRVLR